MKINFLAYTKEIQLLFLFITSIALVMFSTVLLQEINFYKAELATLILETRALEFQILHLENQIEMFKNASSLVVPNSNVWSTDQIVEYICIGCVVITLITTAVFFSYTPYPLYYTAKNWDCSLISYFYPITWVKDQAPRVFRDNLENYYRLVFDTSLDTFILDVQLSGTKTIVSISEFIAIVLKLG